MHICACTVIVSDIDMDIWNVRTGTGIMRGGRETEGGWREREI